ncbi:MAG: enolase C-terminal domain-like protein [Acidimicrobiales bacterium]
MKATLWRQDTTIRVPVRSAGQLHDDRSRLFLRVEHGGVAGFGEVAPQPFELNGDASILDVIDEVRVFVLPQLRQIVEREGALPSWTRIGRFAGSRSASNPAVALAEMALLDRELAASNATSEALWPARYATSLQQTVSLLDDVAFSINPATKRVRAKVSAAPLSTSALQLLDEIASHALPVLLDYNCGATCDVDVLEQVRQVREVVEVAGVEQPYAVGNVVDTARLAELLDVPVSIDEGLRSVRDLAQIVRYRAAGLVCVKPARVGGLANARTIIVKAQDVGLRAYVGGFFESPYGRRVNQWLAANCVDEPSDVGPVEVVLAGYEREADEVAGGFGLRPSLEMLAHGAVLVDVEAGI